MKIIKNDDKEIIVETVNEFDVKLVERVLKEMNADWERFIDGVEPSAPYRIAIKKEIDSKLYYQFDVFSEDCNNKWKITASNFGSKPKMSIRILFNAIYNYKNDDFTQLYRVINYSEEAFKRLLKDPNVEYVKLYWSDYTNWEPGKCFNGGNYGFWVEDVRKENGSVLTTDPYHGTTSEFYTNGYESEWENEEPNDPYPFIKNKGYKWEKIYFLKIRQCIE